MEPLERRQLVELDEGTMRVSERRHAEMELSSLLRELHQLAGRPSYQSLSRRTGLPRSTVYQYLSGRGALPDRDRLITLLVALGVDPEDRQQWLDALSRVRAARQTDPAMTEAVSVAPKLKDPVPDVENRDDTDDAVVDLSLRSDRPRKGWPAFLRGFAAAFSPFGATRSTLGQGQPSAQARIEQRLRQAYAMLGSPDTHGSSAAKDHS